MKKIKVGKKEVVKVEDKEELLEKMRTWSEVYSRWLWAGLGGVVLIFALYWGVTAYGESKERSAQQAYARASEQWPDGEAASDPAQYEKVIPELEKVVTRHKGTKAALNAQVDLSRAFFAVQRYEDALKWAQSALGGSSPGSDLAPLARYHAALAYQQLGKLDEALNQWTNLRTSEPSGLNREVHWHLARIYSEKQQYGQAVEQYEKALGVQGMYPSQTLLEDELTSVRGKTEAPVANTREKSEG